MMSLDILRCKLCSAVSSFHFRLEEPAVSLVVLFVLSVLSWICKVKSQLRFLREMIRLISNFDIFFLKKTFDLWLETRMLC